MIQTAIDADLEAEFAAVAESSGCELVHVEFQAGTLRVFVDRPEGVTVDDCSRVSREISALLDVHDFGSKRYLLEVSSPGLDRKLYGPRDYQRFTGHAVRVAYSANGQKKTVVGRLEAFRPDAARPDAARPDAARPDAARPVAAPSEAPTDGEISVVESATGESLDIPLKDIRVARLEVEL